MGLTLLHGVREEDKDQERQKLACVSLPLLLHAPRLQKPVSMQWCKSRTTASCVSLLHGNVQAQQVGAC